MEIILFLVSLLLLGLILLGVFLEVLLGIIYFIFASPIILGLIIVFYFLFKE